METFWTFRYPDGMYPIALEIERAISEAGGFATNGGKTKGARTARWWVYRNDAAMAAQRMGGVALVRIDFAATETHP